MGLIRYLALLLLRVVVVEAQEALPQALMVAQGVVVLVQVLLLMEMEIHLLQAHHKVTMVVQVLEKPEGVEAAAHQR